MAIIPFNHCCVSHICVIAHFILLEIKWVIFSDNSPACSIMRGVIPRVMLWGKGAASCTPAPMLNFFGPGDLD